MISKHIITPVDLGGMVAAVFAYNERGDVIGLNVFDELGRPVNLGYIEAICEVPGLRIRQTPEQSPEERLKSLAVGAETVTDPRAVPGPTPISALAAATGET